MRTITAIIGSLLLSASAFAAENPLSSRLTVDWQKVPLKKVLKELEGKTGLRFAYAETRVGAAAPVTLKVAGQPASRILRRVLRPRGFEVVLSRKGLAAVIDADGDMGSAKAFGRGLRTFVRLEKKVEGARQTGDEIQIPGWTDEDDQALAEALIDFLCPLVYFGSYRQRQPRDMDLAERMASSYDPDVRAGTVCLLFENLDRRPSEREERVEAVFQRMLADADPIVRSCAIFEGVQWLKREPDRLKSILLEAWRHKTPEVRFAVALVCAIQPEFRQKRSIAADTLTADSSAAVRFMGYVADAVSLARSRSQVRGPTGGMTVKKAGNEEVSRSPDSNALKDRNPIVRTLGIGLVLLAGRKTPDLTKSVFSTLEATGDPWLKAVWSLVAPAMSGKNIEGFNAARDLMLSSKVSHQILGCAAMSVLSTALQTAERFEKKRPRPKPVPGELPNLLDSRNLWVRSTALMICSALEPQKTTSHLMAALKSDEVDRYAALISCMTGRRKLTPKMKEVLLPSSRVISWAEGGLIAEVLKSGLSGRELMDTLIAEIKRDPDSQRVNGILHATRYHSHFSDMTKSLSEYMRVTDAVLAADNVDLERKLIRAWGRNGWHGRGEVVLKLIEKGNPEILAAAGVDFGRVHFLGGKENQALNAIHRRVRGLLASGDRDQERLAAAIIPRLFANSRVTYIYGRDTVLQKERVAITREILETHLDGEAHQFESAALLLSATMLHFAPRGQYRREGKEEPLPDYLRHACIKCLSCVNQPDKGAAALGILRQLIDYCDNHGKSLFRSYLKRERQGENVIVQRVILGNSRRKPVSADLRARRFGPELVKAIEVATESVLKSGSKADRLALRMTQASMGQKAAVDALANSLMDSALERGKRMDVLRILTDWPERQADRFVTWLLSRTESTDEEPAFKAKLIHALARHPKHLPRALGATRTLLKEDVNNRIVADVFWGLQYLAQFGAKERPIAARRPAWHSKLAAFGAEVVADNALKATMRRNGATLLKQYAGPREAALVETLVMDESLSVEMQSEIASALHTAVPETRLYEKLLSKYAQLAKPLRKRFALSAAQSPRAPKAEAFLLAALTDPEFKDRWDLHEVLHTIKLPSSPKLVDAVRTLKAKRFVGADLALRKLKPGKPDRKPVKPPPADEDF